MSGRGDVKSGRPPALLGVRRGTNESINMDLGPERGKVDDERDSGQLEGEIDPDLTSLVGGDREGSFSLRTPQRRGVGTTSYGSHRGRRKLGGRRLGRCN